MYGTKASGIFICHRCLRPKHQNLPPVQITLRRSFSSRSPLHDTAKPLQDDGPKKQEEEEKGAMSRRLSEMSEESLETGGRSAQKAVEEAGFSEELKKQLEQRIADASFRSEHASAFAQANLPSSAGQGTRDIAGAKAWTGTESVEDASLRMLNDAYKPIRVPSRIPGIKMPSRVDTGRSRDKASSGTRLANARDKSSAYSYLKDPHYSEKEREQMRQQLKERFQPGARAVPATIQGLASLANERIEDAISRGQFKNLPRGKKIERDHNASSPFLDTTEYLMNKIIQKQDVVPPWIEKQQELVSTATRFRARLRSDWKRHVARVIGSRGGSLESQIRLAEEYAFAEEVENPRKAKVETVNAIDSSGHLSQITLAGELRTPGASDAQPDKITVTERPIDSSGQVQAPEQQVTITSEAMPEVTPPAPRRPTVPPFRDLIWLETERSYQVLAIENLNTMTRSYNLMAPNLAKKPYFHLDRELRSCYADVAPLIAGEIQERARVPAQKLRVETIGHRPGGVLEKFGGDKAKVWDEQKPQYGFREFWRDLFQKSP